VISPGYGSKIDNSLSNNNPNAVIFLTLNWSANSNRIYTNSVIEPYYVASDGFWWIVDTSGPLPIGAEINVAITNQSRTEILVASNATRANADEICSSTKLNDPFSLVSIEGGYGGSKTPVLASPLASSEIGGYPCVMSSSPISDGMTFALYHPGNSNFVNASANPPSGYTKDYIDMTNVSLAGNQGNITFANGYFQDLNSLLPRNLGVFWDSSSSIWAGFNETGSPLVAPEYIIEAALPSSGIQ
jgi:hypothetical protein